MLDSDMAERTGELGLAAFGSLRAEDEPWLDRCFIRPVNFELMASGRSALIFGSEGGGKTALYRALVRRSYDATGRPLRLVVDWRPDLTSAGPGRLEGTDAAFRQIVFVFQATAEAVVRTVVRYAAGFLDGPEWAQEELAWFIHHFGESDLRLGLGRVAQADNPAIVARLQRLLDKAAASADAPAPLPSRMVAQRLVEALRAIGLEGVWVLSDGVEGWLPGAGDAHVLVDFLSALPLLGQFPGFVYKFILPSALEAQLIHASGVSRGLVEGYHLQWDSAQLRALVEQRLALATGAPGFRLDHLCAADGLSLWLERAGGDSPREWLRQVSYLWEYYQGRPQHEALSDKEWRAARRPPRVFVDEERQLVMVGGRRVGLDEFKGSGYNMLVLLYRRSDKIVSKAELYFLAHQGRASVPRSPADTGYEGPKEYEGIVDTDLWRLRQAIEPDPKRPVLLVAVRGQGVQLRNRW